MDSKKIGRPQKDTRPVNDEKKQISLKKIQQKIS